MEPLSALSEFGTWVAVHELASHDNVFLKMKAFLVVEVAPTIAELDDIATLVPNQLSPIF